MSDFYDYDKDYDPFDTNYDYDEEYPWGPVDVSSADQINIQYTLTTGNIKWIKYEPITSDTTSYFITHQQYKDWLDQNQEEALKKYFKKVLKVIDDLQENIDEIKQLYGDEIYADKIIRDLKAKAYDDLEELLVQLVGI